VDYWAVSKVLVAAGVVGGYVVAAEAPVALAAATVVVEVVVVVVAAVGGGVCVVGLAEAPRVRRGSRQWPSRLGLLAVRPGWGSAVGLNKECARACAERQAALCP
jgi:hypothetical protein